MKEIKVLSWGGGTQSTALMLKMLKGEISDEKTGEVIKPDYIIFADTKDESEMVYTQIYKVIKYIKETYNFDIIITKKNKELLPDLEAIKMIKDGLNYRRSKYSDLYQSHILYFQGETKSIDVMPFWTRNKQTGKVGKTKFKQCTFAFKIDQLLKELRIREGITQFSKNKHYIKMYIGYSVDEIARVKPNPKSYADNFAPLVEMYWTKTHCIEYVKKELGFTPQSSVCNMCYANDFNRVYDIFKNDKKSWQRLLKLDEAMKNKPKNHDMNDDVYMFKWQADNNLRLKNINMEELMQDHKNKDKQLSIFDLESENACMGGCFL